MGRRERREQRRWQRELEEQLRALPTYEGDTPDGGEVLPFDRRLPRQPRAPRAPGARRPRAERGSERRRTVVTVVATLVVIGAVFSASLTPAFTSLRGFLGIEGDRGDSSSYEFLGDSPTTDPPRWSPCEPIRYVVNPGRAPDGWRDELDAALDAVSDASGLEFADEGTSTDGPSSPRFGGDRPLPVLITWVSPEEEPALEGDVVGVAGGSSVDLTYVTGSVVLDAPAFAEMESRGDDDLQRAVIQHELGHLVGLDHVEGRAAADVPLHHLPDHLRRRRPRGPAHPRRGTVLT